MVKGQAQGYLKREGGLHGKTIDFGKADLGLNLSVDLCSSET